MALQMAAPCRSSTRESIDREQEDRGSMVSIPAQIGPYRVLGMLGAGGMGSVFKAESAQGQIVALKMIGALIDTRARFRAGSSLPAFNRSRRLALVREALNQLMESGNPYGCRSST